MFPNYDFGWVRSWAWLPRRGSHLTLAFQMSDERFERFSHVAVTEVPGRYAAAKHGAVIFFRVLYQAGILLGEKEIVCRNAPITTRIVGSASSQFDQLTDHFLFA